MSSANSQISVKEHDDTLQTTNLSESCPPDVDTTPSDVVDKPSENIHRESARVKGRSLGDEINVAIERLSNDNLMVIRELETSPDFNRLVELRNALMQSSCLPNINAKFNHLKAIDESENIVNALVREIDRVTEDHRTIIEGCSSCSISCNRRYNTTRLSRSNSRRASACMNSEASLYFDQRTRSE